MPSPSDRLNGGSPRARADDESGGNEKPRGFCLQGVRQPGTVLAGVEGSDRRAIV